MEEARLKNDHIDVMFDMNINGVLEPNMFGAKMQKLEEEMKKEYEN